MARRGGPRATALPWRTCGAHAQSWPFGLSHEIRLGEWARAQQTERGRCVWGWREAWRDASAREPTRAHRARAVRQPDRPRACHRAVSVAPSTPSRSMSPRLTPTRARRPSRRHSPRTVRPRASHTPFVFITAKRLGAEASSCSTQCTPCAMVTTRRGTSTTRHTPVAIVGNVLQRVFDGVQPPASPTPAPESHQDVRQHPHPEHADPNTRRTGTHRRRSSSRDRNSNMHRDEYVAEEVPVFTIQDPTSDPKFMPSKASSTFGLQKFGILCFIGALASLALSALLHVGVAVIGLANPAWATFKSLQGRKGSIPMKRLGTFWFFAALLFGLDWLCLARFVKPMLPGPMYSACLFLVLSWLWRDDMNASQHAFSNYVEPALLKYETSIDNAIISANSALEGFAQDGVLFLHKQVTPAFNQLHQAAINAAEKRNANRVTSS